jgi:SAM-dependent methyltransferase
MVKVKPFEEYTSEYEDWFRKNHFVYISELKAVRSLFALTGKGVEIGVGTGRFASRLGISLGLDPSIKMLKLARRNGIRVVSAIAEKLPFDNDQFDFALMVTTVCFLNDIESAFIEVRRILRRRGHFIIGFVDRESSIGKLYEKNKENSAFYRVATFYSVDEIISYLRQIGFGHFDFRQTIFQSLNDIRGVEPVESGFGRGSFVAIRAENES